MPETTDPTATRDALVLVVDDYEDNRAMYTEYLTLFGFRVEQASDGGQAVAQAIALVPDVIVMDLSLPVIDGCEASRQIRANPLTAKVPIIALSGHSASSHAKEARAAGCEVYLAKPCMPDVLLENVRTLLAKSRA